MKTVYDNPAEWAKQLTKSDKHWFLDFSNQDSLLFTVAYDLFMESDALEFTDALDEASVIIKDFYNYRYNPETRRTR